jgi:hypothetical protein
MGDMSEMYDYMLREPDGMDVGDPCPGQEWDECTGRMVKRVNRATGEEFVGCSEFPRCGESAPYRPNSNDTGRH